MWVLYKSKQGQNSVRHNQTLTPELCDPITYIQWVECLTHNH